MTEKISEFLTKFDDQHLANLQCATEDGTLVYHDCERCLLHHFQGHYSVTKWEGEGSPLARAAESEYYYLGRSTEWPFTKSADALRREGMLPLIQAEWANRGKRINEIEELTPVSLSVR